MLTSDALSFRYEPGPWIVDHVTIAAERGRVLGIKGPSGVGKSTLGRLLAGHLEPDLGTVRLDGELLPTSGRHPVQYVSQHPEHALDPRWRLGRSLDEAGPRDQALLDDLFIDEDWLERFPRELSGGELQRLTIARALTSTPAAVIADEVSAMLDPVTQAQLWSVLLRRVSQGLILVAITHDDELLDAIADEVITIAPVQITEGAPAPG